MALDKLKEFISYDKETGIFYNINNRKRAKKGELKSSINNSGYLRATIFGKSYLLHRLAFYFINGKMPNNEIDHKNRNKLDNRIENLREVTKSKNAKNRNLQLNNKTGIVGVRWKKGAKQWVANIRINGIQKHLGYFRNFDDAVKARKKAELENDYE